MQLENNKLAVLAYKFRFYVDLAKGQVGVVTAWIPEIAGILGLIWYFTGYKITTAQALIITPLFVFLIWLFGFVWYHLGLYNIEQYTNANKDPYRRELLEAARKINRGDKGV